MEVTFRFLHALDDYLSENGCAYVVFLCSNKPRRVAKHMEKLGFLGVEVIRRQAGIENLCVYRFTRCSASSQPLATRSQIQ